jgi:hypothetical protein
MMATDAARKYLSFVELFTFNLPKQVIEKSLLPPLRAKRGNRGYNDIANFEMLLACRTGIFNTQTAGLLIIRTGTLVIACPRI